MLQAWKTQRRADASPATSWAFPATRRRRSRRDLEIIQRELPLDVLEFFVLTPLPGSEDHQKMSREGAWMDPDMNKYDLEHVVSHHPLMSTEAWQGIYQDAWRLYYTPDHVETILRRAAANGQEMRSLVRYLAMFRGSIDIDRVHPLQGGLNRIKRRTQRRHGLPVESPLAFYPRRAWEVASSRLRWYLLLRRYDRIWRAIRDEGGLERYRDDALTAIDTEALVATEMMQLHGDRIARTYGAPEMKPGAQPATAAR